MEMNEFKNTLVARMIEDGAGLAFINSRFLCHKEGLGVESDIPMLAKTIADTGEILVRNNEAVQAVIAAGLADENFLSLATKFGEILRETAELSLKAIKGIKKFEEMQVGRIQ